MSRTPRSHPFRSVFAARQEFDTARLALYRVLADWVGSKSTFEPVATSVAEFDEAHKRFVAAIAARGLDPGTESASSPSLLERAFGTYLDLAADASRAAPGDATEEAIAVARDEPAAPVVPSRRIASR